MVHEHETVGLALQQMRELTDNYQAPADGCASFEALYDGLAPSRPTCTVISTRKTISCFPGRPARIRTVASRGVSRCDQVCSPSE